MSAKPLRRKPGQWKEVANGRAKKARDIRTGRGLSNIPTIEETGSAAYRRRSQEVTRHGK